MTSEQALFREDVGHSVISLHRVSKSFGGTKALSAVDLMLQRGSVVGLVGANGAGKSTLLRIVAGSLRATAGGMTVGEERIDFATYSPVEACRLGIFMVYQELSVFSNLTVAENFAMAGATRWRRSRKALADFASGALDDVFPGCGILPGTDVGSLSPGDRQMVEIALATSQQGASVLVLDEPTSALPRERVAQLHECIRRRAGEGVAVLYVSHKLEEVLGLSDRVVVLRNGRVTWDGQPGSMTHDELVGILGRTVAPIGEVSKEQARRRETIEVSAAATETHRKPASAVPSTTRTDEGTVQLLEVRHRPGSATRGVSLVVHSGEVVGLAGLEGAGQRGLLREIFAARTRHSPSIRLQGSVGYVSGDRRREGIFALWSIRENLLVSAWRYFSRLGFALAGKSEPVVDHWFQALQIVAQDHDTPVTSLSGGNQQKVLIARGMASEASLLLLDDPTRGVDIETKTVFYSLLQTLKHTGRGVVLYSTEDREFLECDRVYVMTEGTIVKELIGEEITQENIVHFSFARGERVAPEESRLVGPLALGKRRRGLLAGALGGRSRGWPESAAPHALWRLVATSRISLAIFLLVGITVVNSILQPDSVSQYGIDLLLEPVLPLVMASLAQMFVMLAGDFDVSIGYSIGLANVLSATTLASDPPLGVLLLLAVVGGYVLMAVIRQATGVPAIVITLGASFIWLGIGLNLQAVPGGTAPGWLEGGLNATLPVIAEPIYIALGLALVTFVFLRRTRYGAALRSFGNSPQSYADRGRSCLRARVVLYLLAGFCAAAGGVLVTVTTTASDINASSTLTLTSITAVVLGGAEFMGGIVEPVGTVVAAVALGLIVALLAFLGVSAAYETAVTGLILIGAMAIRWAVRRRATWLT
jgi:ribose transport system ATP-binding protein